MLKGKNILLGITGSIAAYKSAYLCRLLVKEGATVKVVMTKSATAFISPLTLSTLSKNDVLIDFWDNSQTWNGHVELGLWADIYIIAPTSANTIAKMANGICDNILLASFLSAKCTVSIAPAMDLDMWKHPATKRNIKTLQEDGIKVIPVEKGELASGLLGEGRMSEPENILSFIKNEFNKK